MYMYPKIPKINRLLYNGSITILPINAFVPERNILRHSF